MIHLYAILVGSSAIFGAMGGFYVCHTWYSHAYLKDEVARLEKSLKAYETMVGVSRRLNAEDHEIEQLNREIEDAIIRRAREMRSDDEPVCVESDWLRELEKLR